MLKLVKAIQIAWSFLLLFVFGMATMRGFGASGKVSYIHLFLAVVAMVYVGAAFLCQYNNYIAWWVALPIPALLLFMYLPPVFHNFAMFLTGHELYLDSPATVFIVLIYALVLVMPALLIYFGMFRERRTVAAILFKKVAEREPSGKIERLFTLEGIKRLQLAWAIVLLLYYARYFVLMLLMMESHAYYAVMFVGAIVYFAAAIICFSNNRVAWATTLLLPLAPIVRHLYVLGRYIWIQRGSEDMDFEFITQYHDAIQSILFFVLPMAYLYYYLFHERKTVSSILFRNSVKENPASPDLYP